MLKIKLKPFDFEKDIKTVCEFHKDHVKINFPDSLYKKHLFKSQLEDESKRNDQGLLMISSQKFVENIGFLWLKIMYDPYKELFYGDLHYIHLVPKCRGLGIGNQLMKYAEDYFKKKGCEEIRLGTDANNGASISLYEKSGFVLKRVLYEKKI